LAQARVAQQRIAHLVCAHHLHFAQADLAQVP